MAKLPKYTRCAVCNSEHRDRVDSMIAIGGASNRIIGKQFSFSKDQIQRHSRHLEPARRAALLVGPAKVAMLANAAADESKSLLDYLTITRSVLFNQFLSAAEAGDRNGTALVAGRLLDALEKVGKLTGELRNIAGITIHNQTNVNLVANPEFIQLTKELVRVLRPHPAAREEVITVLREWNQDVANFGDMSNAPMIDGHALECEAVG
jgi:hypothetical protein